MSSVAAQAAASILSTRPGMSGSGGPKNMRIRIRIPNTGLKRGPYHVLRGSRGGGLHPLHEAGNIRIRGARKHADPDPVPDPDPQHWSQEGNLPCPPWQQRRRPYVCSVFSMYNKAETHVICQLLTTTFTCVKKNDKSQEGNLPCLPWQQRRLPPSSPQGRECPSPSCPA
jgi:hypothetical protein